MLNKQEEDFRLFFIGLVIIVFIVWLSLGLMSIFCFELSSLSSREIFALLPLSLLYMLIGYYLLSILITAILFPESKYIKFNPMVWLRKF